MYCYKCGHETVVDHKIGREEVCPACTSYLHCCLNCRFYNPFRYRECEETEIEWVEDKKIGNFCDYFKPSDKKPALDHRHEESRKKLDDLFKNKK